MNKYKGFIQIDGAWFNVNSILAVKRSDFDKSNSIITFINGEQKVVEESLLVLMNRLIEAKEEE